MSDAATQTGVVNGRAQMMKEIAAAREEQIDAEMKDGGTPEGIGLLRGEESKGDPLRPESVPVEDWDAMSDEQKGLAIAEAKEAEAAPAPAATDEPSEPVEARKIKGKVDGQEVEFDEKQVLEAGLRALQKESAADRRLEEATRVAAEAERLRAEAEAIAAKAPVQQAPSQPQGFVMEKADLAEIVKAIQYGTQEEAAAALQAYGEKMAQLGQSGSLTRQELDNALDLREARKYVAENYSDVVSDPRTKTLFVSEVNAKLAAGDQRPYRDICIEVGDSLRTWKGVPPKTDPTPNAGGSRKSVAERKTSIVTITSASARQPAPTTPRVETPSETIARMRDARGRRPQA